MARQENVKHKKILCPLASSLLCVAPVHYALTKPPRLSMHTCSAIKSNIIPASTR